MDPATIMTLINLGARVTTGLIDALTLNQTERLPALRAYSERITQMTEAGIDPTPEEIEALKDAINADIDAIHQRAEDARNA